MKKIIYLTIVDISEKNGQGIYALKTMESFTKKLNKEELILIMPRPKDIKVLDKFRDFKIYFLPSKKKRNVLRHFYIQIKLLFILFKIGKVNAIIYSLKPMMISPLIYSKVFKVPIYLLVEGLAKNTINNVTKGILKKIGLKVLETNIRLAKRVYPAYISANEWVKKLNKNTKIINCGVDLNIFKPLIKEKTDKLTIGYVGSFRKVHKIKELVSIVVSKYKNEINLVLVGDGELKREIENFIRGNKINNILLLGSREQMELVKIFSNIDVMWGVNDINHWGIPIKCFEYLACNKKIIYTDKEDLKFIEDNGWGYKLNNTDIKSIENVLSKILEDYKEGKLVDNKNSCEYIKQYNNWDNFAEIVVKDVENDN